MSKVCFLIRILFISIFSLLSTTTFAFISYYLLTNDTGNTILILGDCHFEAALKQKNEEHINLFVAKALASKNGVPIPCIVELDDSSAGIFKGECLSSGFAVADTITHLATYASKGILDDKLTFIACDPRGLDSLLISDMNKYLSRYVSVIQTNELLPSQEQWNLEVKPQVLQASNAQDYTLKEYFHQLDKYALDIEAFVEKHTSCPLYKQLFAELYRNFTKAIEQAKNYFAHIDLQRPLVLALLDTFDGHLEPRKYLRKYEEFNMLFSRLLDFSYLDICYLNKIVSLCPQSSTKLVLMVGGHHATALCEYLKQIGYKSILEEVNHAHLATAIDIYSPCLINLEMAYYLLFSSTEMEASLLPKLEKATLFGRDKFKEIVADNLKRSPVFGQRLAVMKHYEVSSSVFLNTTDGTLKTVPNAYCHNTGCENSAVSRCGRCQEARYCSKECQRAHWHIEHKIKCKR